VIVVLVLVLVVVVVVVVYNSDVYFAARRLNLSQQL
jgi:hypothetical protein